MSTQTVRIEYDANEPGVFTLNGAEPRIVATDVHVIKVDNELFIVDFDTNPPRAYRVVPIGVEVVAPQPA